MTLLHQDGFEEGLWALEYGAVTTGLALVAGRFGGSALRRPAVNGLFQMSKGITASATVVAGVAVRVSAVASAQQLLVMYGDGGVTQHVLVQINSPTGQVALYRGGVLLATAPDTIVANTWYYVELKATIADSGGRATVRLNGTIIIDFTGDTKNAGTSTNIDTVYPVIYGSTNTQTADIDDLYIANGLGTVNNDFLGDVRVITLSPNGNGNSSGLLGSDADSVNNYLLVNEAAPYNTATYVGSPTVTTKDTYAFADVGVAGTVKGLSVVALAANSDAGAGSMKLVTRRGVTDYASAAKTLGASYLPIVDLQELDPSTAAAWTTANVDGAEFGVEVA